MNILFVSLGCDKNLVDSEMMLGLLAKKGYDFTDNETEADVIVVIPAVLSGTPKKRASIRSWRCRNTGKADDAAH